ncbi:hypothetical protein PENANT_c004G11574 [Penicillium antarcticum]|uniref:Secreted protein n=2 Tax=Penicillium antarcticum TaxID=416450 RepID=A0A1V6QFW0_9EURO|nr:hypothetical protein PENANT_c004G11574 [Penicillium antarcticum]
MTLNLSPLCFCFCFIFIFHLPSSILSPIASLPSLFRFISPLSTARLPSPLRRFCVSFTVPALSQLQLSLTLPTVDDLLLLDRLRVLRSDLLVFSLHKGVSRLRALS